MSSFNEQRGEILGMLRDEKISVEEAEKLLDAISNSETETMQDSKAKSNSKLAGKKVCIKIVDDEGGENVEVNIPAMLIRFANFFTIRNDKMPEIDMDELADLVENGAIGDIVKIQKNGKNIVEVSIMDIDA